MTALRLTAAQACVRYMANQFVAADEGEVPYFAGVWAIFGHGNVAGIGEALAQVRDALPTYRAHNEQAMAHAAIAYAKQMRRRRAMACTTSIGPGATNLVTSAALAHVNRLPVLFLPGDVYASRRPDPVLQQIEDFGDATVSANDCLRPVSRYFDRITRPEQLLDALPRALATLLDPANCGPATLAFCQDVQAEAFDYPVSFFEPRQWRIRRSPPDSAELEAVAAAIQSASSPLIIAGGGVHYSGANTELAAFAEQTGIPVAETQAGKGALAWDHPLAVGAIGVTGTGAANALAAKADLVVGVGTRLQDFTTGSWAVFDPQSIIAQVNICAHDAHKRGALVVIGDARSTLQALSGAISGWRVPDDWSARASAAIDNWNSEWTGATTAREGVRPSDAEVIGGVWRSAPEDSILVCAAGGLPGELHKLWRTRRDDGYHVEYGYSCMGYEIGGALGVKLAVEKREVIVMVGDGSYLMLNSELATSVAMGAKLIVVLLDNRGFGCINRLQQAAGGEPFNNLLSEVPEIDFAAHAAALGAKSEKVADIADLERAMERALQSDRSYVIVIETDPERTSEVGGAWWDVAIPEVSDRAEVRQARSEYERQLPKVRR